MVPAVAWAPASIGLQERVLARSALLRLVRSSRLVGVGGDDCVQAKGALPSCRTSRSAVGSLDGAAATETDVTSFESRGQQDLREVITADLVAMGISGPLRRKLPSFLEPRETVTAVGICTPAGRWWNEVRDVQTIVVTDRRLLFISTKFLGADGILEEARERQPKSFHYRDIRGVKERLGWLESKLDLDVSGRTIQLTSMRRKAACAAADAVRRHAPVALRSL
jgi:Bacterial PH domain